MLLGPLWILPLCVILVISLWSGSSLLSLVVTLALLISGSLPLWRRYCLTGVTYERQISVSRAAFGEVITLVAKISNVKALPLTWLRIDDTLPSGVIVLDGNLGPYRRSGVLHLFLAVLPYQRVTKRMRLHCMRRGMLSFGPATLESGDYLGTRGQRLTNADVNRLLVYPKVFRLQIGRLPSEQVLGRDSKRRSLLADPVRAIGARDYRPGDPYRSIDWRSSARFDRLMVRVAEPSTTPSLELVLNLEITGRSDWEGDAIEFAISLVASLCRYAVERRWAVGLLANGDSDNVPVFIRPSAAAGQFPAIMEVLASADVLATRSVTSLLAPHALGVSAGTTLLLVTTSINERLRSALIELHRLGWGLLVLYVAPQYVPMRAEGFPLIRVPYEANWVERDALVLGQ
jgi:uncharacterized protein (DUF58 family)